MYLIKWPIHTIQNYHVVRELLKYLQVYSGSVDNFSKFESIINE